MHSKDQAESAAAVVAAALTSVEVREGTKMNGLKHGLRSDAILLPGDDAAEFHEAREDLLHMYQVHSRAETRCVERIAGLEWRMARHARLEATFDDKLAAVLDDSGTACQHNDPDPHRWQHRGDDCNKREARLERMLARTERRLFLLQQMRRNRLLAAGTDTSLAVSTLSERKARMLRRAEVTLHPDQPAAPVAAKTVESDNRWAQRPATLAPAPEPEDQWVRLPSVPLRILSSSFSGPSGADVSSAEMAEPMNAAGELATHDTDHPSATDENHSEIPICDDREEPAARPPPASIREPRASTRGHLVGGWGMRRIYRSAGA